MKDTYIKNVTIKMLLTFPFAGACVSALPSRNQILAASGARVDGHWLADDQTILDKFPDVLSAIGVGDFRVFIGVEPDFVLTTFQYIRGQTFLQPQITVDTERKDFF